MIFLQGKEEVAATIDAHPNEKCILVKMRTKKVETATNKGDQGADAYLFFLHRLPPEYVTKDEEKNAGWKNKKGNLDTVLPGKSIGGDIYRNDDRKLPHKNGRTWYEADINYTGGYRNHDRVLYSDDGLIFITYDHYHTYYELTK